MIIGNPNIGNLESVKLQVALNEYSENHFSLRIDFLDHECPDQRGRQTNR